MTYADMLRTSCLAAVAVGWASPASAVTHTLGCKTRTERVDFGRGGFRVQFVVETTNPLKYVVRDQVGGTGTQMTSPPIPVGARIIVTRRVTAQQNSAAATLRFKSIHGILPGASETFPTARFNGRCSARAEW